jgi:hypothetical protein
MSMIKGELTVTIASQPETTFTGDGLVGHCTLADGIFNRRIVTVKVQVAVNPPASVTT